MAKHFVTTMNKRLFDDYGKDLLVSYMNTSQKYPIYVYVEDDIQNDLILDDGSVEINEQLYQVLVDEKCIFLNIKLVYILY